MQDSEQYNEYYSYTKVFTFETDMSVFAQSVHHIRRTASGIVTERIRFLRATRVELLFFRKEELQLYPRSPVSYAIRFHRIVIQMCIQIHR